MRMLLAYAQTFDPLRTGKLSLAQTMDRLGWSFNQKEMISDGLFVDFSMADSFCAFELVDSKFIVDLSSPEASTTPASPAPPFGGDGKVMPPQSTPFRFAPAAWEDPCLGMVLDKTTAARHALIRSKGWALVAIPLPLWELACKAPKDAHYARRDLLLSMTLTQAPFEPRPVTTGSQQQQQQQQQQAAAGEDELAGSSASTKAVAAASGGTGASTSNRAKRRNELVAESAKVLAAGGKESTASTESAGGVEGGKKKRKSVVAARSPAADAAAAAVKLAGASGGRKGGKVGLDKEEDDNEAEGGVVPRDEGEEEEADNAADAAAGAKKPKAAAGAGAAAPKARKKEGRGMGGRGR